MTFCDRHGGEVRGIAVARAGWLAVVLVVTGVSVQAAAQEQPEIESAGNEARFRVIDRLEGDGGEIDDEARPAVDWRVDAPIRAGLKRRDWRGVAARLAEEGSLPEATGDRFVYAYTQEELEHWERAYEAWKSIRGQMPALTDYVDYFGAKAALRSGHVQDATIFAAGVGRESRLYPWSLEVLARGLLETGTEGDVERAKTVAQAHLEHFPKAPNRVSMRYLHGRAALADGAVEKGAESLFDVLRRAPLSDVADEAREALESHREQLSEAQRRRLESPSRELQEARFEALFDAHRNDRVVDELPSALEDWTPGGRLRCRGLYWLGKTYSKLREHESAREWYGKILSECRGVSPFEKKALYLDGESAWNAGDTEAALERFEAIRKRFAEHSFADDAYYFAARIHREEGRFDRAKALLEEQLEKHPDGDMAGDARWMLVEKMLEDEKHEKVVEYVDDLAASENRSESVSERLRYFRGRALEALDRGEKAKETYRRLARESPFRVHGLLAANRFVRLATSQRPLPRNLCSGAEIELCDELAATARESEIEPAFELPASVRERREFGVGLELLRLGVRDWAASEFRRLLGGLEDGSRAFWAVADLLDRAGEHDFAYRLPSRVDGWRGVYPGSRTDRIWSIAFPRPHHSTVVRHADGTTVDVPFVYAVIRKESGFTPGIRSWAGATGLMQLMEKTAEGVAEEIGASEVDGSRLRRPGINIRLGVAYLNQLGERFDGHPALMAAGYNAGAGRVEEWLDDHSALELDRWIEAIPFGQTRDYVKGILGFWWAYRWIEEGPVVPRVSFALSGSD